MSRPCRPCRRKNSTAYQGLIAASTAGSRTSWFTPRAASVKNQTSMIGPNNRPTIPVPARWMENSASRITQVIGTTPSFKAGLATARPSTALSTEMAGVITPSP